MKKKNLLFLSVLLGLLSACSSTDDVRMEAGYGAVDLTVTTNTSIETRAESRTSNYVYLPPLEDYLIRLEKTDGEAFVKQDSFKNCEDALKLPVGSYKMSVYYGDENEEGYARRHKEDDGIDPYIYGETEFVLSDQEVKSLSVHCVLQRALLNISCSEAFREIYGDSAEVVLVTANNKIIAWDKDDERTLVLKSGKLKLNINVENNGVLKTYSHSYTLQDRGLYNLELKVNASTGMGTLGSILVSYDDATREEPVVLELEQYTSHPAPYLIFKGAAEDGSEALREVVLQEGTSSTEEESLVVVAQGGLASLVMQTESSYLTANGWPEEIDLLAADEAQKEQLKNWGLEMRGVKSGAKMLSLNFDKVFSRIVASDNDNVETTVSFTLTDEDNRTSEKVYAFKCTTTPINFASSISQIDCVWGTSEIVVPITMDGDVNKLTASYLAESGVTETCKPTKIESAEGEHAYLVTFPIAIGTVDTEVTLSYADGVREQRIMTHLLPPVYTLSVEAGDVWSKRASVKLNAEANYLEQISKNQNMVKLQYSTDGAQWIDVPATFDASTMSMNLTGLNPNTTYQVRSLYGDILMESTVSFTTEKTSQLANSTFDEWSSEKKGDYQYLWATSGWATLNELTISESGSGSGNGLKTGGVAYKATSGTIPANSRSTKTEDDGGTWGTQVSGDGNTCGDANLHSDKAHGGSSNAALIRTVGWGNQNTAAANGKGKHAGTVKHATAGELYLGSYNGGANYGIDFVSRPESITFWYHYDPATAESDDYGYAEIKLYDAEGNEIASAISNINAIATWTEKTLQLTYSSTAKAAKISVLFKSSNNPNALNIEDKYWRYPGVKNVSGGEYVGSELYIDDITLNY